MEMIKEIQMKNRTRNNVLSAYFSPFAKVMLSCLVLIGLFCRCSSLNCPQKSPMKNFDISKYLQTYYEIYYYGNDNFTNFHRCPVEDFYTEPNNSYVLYGSVLSFTDNERFNWTGIFETNVPGIFNVTQYIYDDIFHFNLYVLGTDYKEWIVLWSCPFLTGKEAAWIMTRRQILVNETLTPREHLEITQVLNHYDIPWSRFQRTLNYDCNH